MAPIRNDIGKAITTMNKTEDKQKQREAKYLVICKHGQESRAVSHLTGR